MRIGLLEAEILPPKVVAEFGGYGDMFERLLSPHRPQWEFIHYDAEHGELPQSTADCDAYIITGSRHNAYDRDPWIEALKNFIRRLEAEKIPLLGICFGHQVVAAALGGKVEKSAKGWGIGPADFRVCDQPSWLKEKYDTFSILVSHQDQVTELPEGARLLFSSDFCPIGGFYIGNHILCMQGHPEFENRYLYRLLTKRKPLIGSKLVGNSLILLEKYSKHHAAIPFLVEFIGQC